MLQVVAIFSPVFPLATASIRGASSRAPGCFTCGSNAAFEPTGAECGTVYDESVACKICGAGRSTVDAPLRLNAKKIPKNEADPPALSPMNWFFLKGLQTRLSGKAGGGQPGQNFRIAGVGRSRVPPAHLHFPPTDRFPHYQIRDNSLVERQERVPLSYGGYRRTHGSV